MSALVFGSKLRRPTKPVDDDAFTLTPVSEKEEFAKPECYVQGLPSDPYLRAEALLDMVREYDRVWERQCKLVAEVRADRNKLLAEIKTLADRCEMLRRVNLNSGVRGIVRFSA